MDETAMALNGRLLAEQHPTPETTSTDSNIPFQFPESHLSSDKGQPVFSRPNLLGASNGNVTREAPSPEPARSQTDQEGHYIGSSSAVAFLIRIQKRLHQNSSLSHDSSIFTFGDAPLPEFDPSFFVLPPKADAQRLVERYFDYAAPTHRFLHRPTMEKLVEEFYETQGDMRSKEDAPAKTALLLIVFAQAQAYVNMQRSTM
jgi:hypothetical protein